MILHIKSYSVNCFFRFPGSIQIEFSEILVQLSNLFLRYCENWHRGMKVLKGT